MKRLTAVAASALALTAATTSCDEEDRSTRFSDISIESLGSVETRYSSSSTMGRMTRPTT